jgi:hypothetical protein
MGLGAYNVAGAATAMTFYTGASVTEQMRITSAGNVGIGTASPAAKLDVLTGTNTNFLVGFGANLDNYYTAGASGLHIFRNGLTERARIDSSGSLLVNRTNQTSDNGRVVMQEDGASKAVLCLSNSDTSATSQFLLRSIRNGNSVGGITNTNTNTAFPTSSDYRLKNSITPMTGALAKVALLKPVTYKWNIDGSDGQGFIAHELQGVVDECVIGEKDAVETYTDEDGGESIRPVYQGIDTSFLVATLTAAIQEQQALITQLQADVAALKGASA